MIVPEEDPPDRESRLNDAIAEYYQLVERGGAVDPQAFLSRYPDLANDLAAFFADKAAFDQRVGAPVPLAGEQVPSPEPKTLPPQAPPTAPPSDDTALGLEDETALHGTRRKTSLPRFGDFELLEEISRSGRGVLWRARQISFDRVVALKLLRVGQLASPVDVARFRAEVEAAGQLEHPNILPILEVGDYAGLHYCSMKLMRGSSLAQEMPDLANDPTRTAQLLSQVARAVHHAHQRGFLHLNLKPANILLDIFGKPFVTEFGLARGLPSPACEPGEHGLTPSGAVAGTPAYVAPEQARADSLMSVAVDIWSIGVILYECLTGQKPFRGDSPLETVMAVLRTEPTPPSTLRPGVDADLAAICLKCLQKEPAQRYQSAGELADELQRWIRREPVVVRPREGDGKPRVSPYHRNPAIAVLAASLVLVTLAGAAGVYYMWCQAEAAREREAALLASESALTVQAENERDTAFHHVNASVQANDDQRRALDAARQSVYLHEIALAQQAWKAGNLPLMREWLVRCPASVRGWEWGYLRRLAHNNLREDQQALPLRGPGTLNEHAAAFFHPDSARFTAATAEGELKTWDVRTGENLSSHTAGKYAGCRAFSPDRLWLATTLLADTDEELARIARTQGLQTSPGMVPQMLKQANVFRICLIDARTGAGGPALEAHEVNATGLAFSGDGKRLAVCAGRGAKVWEIASGKKSHTLGGHEALTTRVAFSPDGRWLATGSDAAGDGEKHKAAIKLWDLSTGKESGSIHSPSAAGEPLLFSPDGSTLVTPGENGLMLWRLLAGTTHTALAAQSRRATAAVFSTDGAILATAGMDRAVYLWDVKKGQLRATLAGHTRAPAALVFSPDGRRLISSATIRTEPAHGSPRGEMKVWNVETGQALLTLDGQGELFFSPDGLRLASAAKGHSPRIWDASEPVKKVSERSHQ